MGRNKYLEMTNFPTVKGVDKVPANWLNGKRESIGLPVAEWTEVEGHMQQILDILKKHGRSFDNHSKLKANESRACLSFFSNPIVREEEGDRASAKT